MIIDPFKDAIFPAAELLPRMDSVRARVLLCAIGLQESRFKHRLQIRGPARGFWQFERGGGVRGVLTHKASRLDAAKICFVRGCGNTLSVVYDRVATDDVLAACFARLLLYTDPAALPELGERDKAWDYYIRCWRPGKPHRRTWNDLYDEAVMLATQAVL